MLTMDTAGWVLTTPLPRAVYGVRGVTVGGRLYMTGKQCCEVTNIRKVLCSAGGYDGDEEDDRAEILVWLDDEQEWEETGKMKMSRSNHAVSTIHMADQAMEHCG